MSNTDINVIGIGQVTPTGFDIQQTTASPLEYDVKPFLKSKKSRKFLSKQDAMALIASSKAWQMAQISDPDYSQNTGIYFCVGILPFEDIPLDTLAQKSQKNNELDLALFSSEAFHAMNPLLTFKCLPNMPLFHISHNLQITGHYFVTYPGVREWFCALKRAIDDLRESLVKYAIVGAVADQNNFLVQHHTRRTAPELEDKLIDCGAAMVLTLQESPKVLAKITHIDIKYSSFNAKNATLNKSSYFALATGAVEPALYCNLHIEQKKSGTLIYQAEPVAGSNLSLQMEIR